MDIEKKRELWDRLENEPERAYRAFESYRSLPSSRRTLIVTYRQHVGNPSAAKPSDTWSRWSNQFAWRERTADLESEDFVQQMRPQDVINIMKLHFEVAQKLGVRTPRLPTLWWIGRRMSNESFMRSWTRSTPRRLARNVRQVRTEPKKTRKPAKVSPIRV